MKKIENSLKGIFRRELLVCNYSSLVQSNFASSVEQNQALFNYLLFCIEQKLKISIPDDKVNMQQPYNEFVKVIYMEQKKVA
ncbi:MAG: hypothetical protein RLZZ175_1823 [Bacteroidota bacterium]|jgi:hypothetical protein